MDEKERKSKLFVIIMAIIVIGLIIIGCVLTWDIIQDGRKNSNAMIQAEQSYIEYVVHAAQRIIA